MSDLPEWERERLAAVAREERALKHKEIEEWKAEHPGEELPEYYRSGEFWDSHSCNANASSYGICQICGAIVRGTTADYDIHGYDPTEEW